jgi:NDP-sugar pyrophosphorylase family protein
MPEAADAILLCGGAGLRLRSVIGNAPKGMAEVAGRPILELLLNQLRRHGFERVILAVGYQNEAIQAYFGERACGMRVEYSIESHPLGTGGALGNAAGLIERDHVLIMNGDSYTDADLTQFAAEHSASGADVSLVVVPFDARTDSGTVSVDASGRLTGFWEKQTAADARYVNAGIYMASRQILASIPRGPVSLEQDLFPQWLVEGRNIRAFVWPGTCVDIGTPERLESAQRLLENAEGAAQGQSQL